MSTGECQKSLNKIMAAMNVPGMSKNNIISSENQIGTSWGNILAEEIKAGEEEKQLAQERGDIANGYPAITAIVDGGG